MKAKKYAVAHIPGPMPGSVSCVMVITHIMVPTKDKQPYNLCATPLQVVRIPVFPPPGNLKGKPLEDFKQRNADAFRASEAAKLAASLETGVPMDAEGVFVTTPGGDSLKIAKFAGIGDITTGFYKVSGLTCDIYEGRPTLKCSGASPVSYEEATRLWKAIPFAERSFDLEADIPTSENRDAFAEDWARKLMIIDIDKESADPEALFGTFAVPEGIAKCAPSYKSQSGVEIEALMGGLDDNGKAEDNQLLLTQRKSGEHPSKILAMTKLYATDLRRLQSVQWETFAYTFYPHIRGVLFATLDRRESSRINITDPELAGVVSVGSMFIPDLQKIAPLVGYLVSWPTCLKFAPRLAEGRVMSESELSLRWANGVNILEYTGDISLIPKAMERGWVKTYVVTAHLFNENKKQTLRRGTEEELFKKLSDPGDFYKDRLDLIIYAVLTPEAPPGYAITDFVSRARPRASDLFDEPAAKRVKTEA